MSIQLSHMYHDWRLHRQSGRLLHAEAAAISESRQPVIFRRIYGPFREGGLAEVGVDLMGLRSTHQPSIAHV
jgi:hypothetical protein